MEAERNGGAIDQFRILAALLVVAIHTSPLASHSAAGDVILTRIVARIAVPFFLMVTGYYLLPPCLDGAAGGVGRALRAVRKTALLYGASTLLYLPFSIYARYYAPGRGLPLSILKKVLFDGTFYHLWYLPATIIGVGALCALGRYLPQRAVMAVAVALYLAGLLGDSYYGLTQLAPPLRAAYLLGFRAFAYTRNGLFYAPIFLMLGARAAQSQSRPPLWRSAVGFPLSMLLLLAEGTALHRSGLPRHDSMYLLLPLCMVFLFQLLLSLNGGANKRLRLGALCIYVLHPLLIIAVRGAGKILGLEAVLIGNSLLHFLAVSVLSCLAALLIVWVWERRTTGCALTGRAWIELDRAALRHNVETLDEQLAPGCRLMPVVKANAYGHGAAPVAKELQRLGARCLCVACVAEAVELRKKGVWCDLLILGYTHPRDFFLLRKYRLTQTVLDSGYAQLLDSYGKRIKVHIKVDTGMHRLGERWDHPEGLVSTLSCSNLQADGVFTHLCAADTDHPADVAYTRRQEEAFGHILEGLRDRGYRFRNIHIQSSYGALRQGRPMGSGIRVGIALYGMLGTAADTRQYAAALRPVLSLRARVAAIKPLCAGEVAGYGLEFTAACDATVAVLSIGYADGVSRSLSCGVGSVLVHGKRAPIIGRVCMDQTLIDVSHIPQARRGDIATLIGTDGSESISACEIAGQTGTIANEVLAGLGSRLQRILV